MEVDRRNLVYVDADGVPEEDTRRHRMCSRCMADTACGLMLRPILLRDELPVWSTRTTDDNSIPLCEECGP